MQTELPPENAIQRIGEDWKLTDEIFTRWWSMLAEEDRQEFVYLHGGESVLARFVCALDYLTIQKVRAPDAQLFQLAYSIAANIPQGDPTLRSRASRAWKHDAVQTLLDRVRYRSSKQRAIKVENNHLLILQRMQEAVMNRLDKPDGDVTEDDINLGVAVASSANKYMQIVSAEETKQRAERTKRGIESARKAHPNEDMGDRELEVFLKASIKKIPTDKLLALLPPEVKATFASSEH